MSKHYNFLLAAALLAGSMTAEAIERPTTPAGAPEDGGKYVLVNAYSPTGYMSRTSWDGALYFLGETDSNYADYAFTAQKNEDGTWSFYYVVGKAADGETDSLSYLGIITSGTCNLNAKSPTPVKWTVEEGSMSGFYSIIAGEGNLDGTVGYKLHLNADGQYFVISEELDGGSWYPDYAGGSIEADNDYGYEVDSNGRALLADHTSENWGFIAVDDVPEHMAKYGSYNLINTLENDYLAIEGYETGFQATLTAVTAIYENAEFDWEIDPATIEAMVNGKIDLYEAIESAKAIENPDAALSNAISNATTSFQTVTSATEVEGILNSLNTAVEAFKQGNGDMTGLGINMSFEDLTAQGGSQTTGIAAAPPVGWTVTIEGDTVTTADEVKAHGIANWFGVNNDCEGDGLDGEVCFGIWTSGVPEFQIAQTVTGLENGTYVVSAGLMVGANTSGSRRTTQRIFGNFNSTYFATEGEYDASLLDQGEVMAFMGLAEPVTDRQLQLVEARAYVYDGTLTFGLRTDGNYKAALRESSNSAGGDGWFKVDNFRLQYEGYVGEDAAAVANHFITAYENLKDEPMQATLSEEVNAILDSYSVMNAETPVDDINNAIVTLSSKMDEVQSSIDAYVKLNEAIENGYNNADAYQYYKGIDDYTALIEEALEGYEEGSYDEAQIDEIIANMAAKLEEVKKSGIAVGEYLDIITNASFEDMSAQNNTESDGSANPPAGWDLYLNGTKCETSADYSAAGATFGWCAINKGDGITETDQNGTEWTTQYTDGTHLWGIWAANVPDVQLSQTFEGIPNGTFTLSCDMVVQYNWGGHCVTTQRIFANDYVQMYGAEETYAAHLNFTDDMEAAYALDNANPDADLKHLNYAGWLNESSYGATSCPHAMSLTFGVDDGNLTIGFRTNNVDPFSGEAHPYDSAGWFKLDNFKLFYESSDVPTGMKSQTTTSGQQVQLLGQQYYSVGGARLSQPQKGVTIVKNVMSDGSVKVTKILK